MEALIILYFLAGMVSASSILRGKEGHSAYFTLIALFWPLVLLLALYIRYLNRVGVDRPLNIRVLPKKKLSPR